MDSQFILTPVLQNGFLGLSAVLLAIVVWLIRRLLEVLDNTNAVISENTEAIRCMDERNAELLRLCGDMRDRLLVRPCIAESERRSA